MSSCLRERMGQLVLGRGVSVLGYCVWGVGEITGVSFPG